MQAYLVNGKMFAAVGDHGTLVKLPKEVREPLVAARQAETMVMGTGAAFGEWVTLPSSGLEQDRKGILALIRQSFDYVLSAPRPARPPREQRHFRKRQY